MGEGEAEDRRWGRRGNTSDTAQAARFVNCTGGLAPFRSQLDRVLSHDSPSREPSRRNHERHERLAKTMIPACRWDVYGFRPSFYRLRRVFAEGDQHRMVIILDPRQRHIPHRFPTFCRRRRRTDPLACASSFCALARPPYKHAARASGSGVFPGLCRGEAAYGVRELVPAFWSTAARKHPSSRVPISQLRSAISDALRPQRS